MSSSIKRRTLALRIGAAVPIVALVLDHASATTAIEAAAIALPGLSRVF
jgi:hypothetical protein